MLRSVVRAALGVAALGVALTSPLHAQLQLPEGVTIRLSGQLHVQFNTTSRDSALGTALPESEFLIRRARVALDIRLSDLLSARLDPDFSGGTVEVRDAYARLTLGDPFRVTVGQFKRPFDVFELTSSSRLLVVERSGDVRGVTACGQIGRVCTFSALTEGLLFADRDVGVMVDGGVAADRLRYAVALTNGRPTGATEDNTNKSVTGRVTVRPVADIAVGVNAARKDYTHLTSGDEQFAFGWGADLEVGDFDAGPHVFAGVVGGDNWLAPTGPTTVATFLTAQVIASYRVPLPGAVVNGVQPVLRVSWADPDTDIADDGGWLVTPGLILHLGGRTSLHGNVDIWKPQLGNTEYSIKSQVFLYF